MGTLVMTILVQLEHELNIEVKALKKEMYTNE